LDKEPISDQYANFLEIDEKQPSSSELLLNDEKEEISVGIKSKADFLEKYYSYIESIEFPLTDPEEVILVNPGSSQHCYISTISSAVKDRQDSLSEFIDDVINKWEEGEKVSNNTLIVLDEFDRFLESEVNNPGISRQLLELLERKESPPSMSTEAFVEYVNLSRTIFKKILGLEELPIIEDRIRGKVLLKWNIDSISRNQRLSAIFDENEINEMAEALEQFREDMTVSFNHNRGSRLTINAKILEAIEQLELK
jgi:hypothetical protein